MTEVACKYEWMPQEMLNWLLNLDYTWNTEIFNVSFFSFLCSC